MSLPVSVDFTTTGNLSAPTSAGGQLGTTGLYDQVGNSYSVASAVLSDASSNFSGNYLTTQGGGSPALNQVIKCRVNWTSTRWLFLVARANGGAWYLLKLQAGSAQVQLPSSATLSATSTTGTFAPAAGSNYWVVWVVNGTSPTTLTLYIYADTGASSPPSPGSGSPLYTATYSDSTAALNNAATSYYMGVSGGYPSTGSTGITQLVLDQYAVALTAGDLAVSSAGATVSVSTATVGGAGSNQYTLFGCDTTAGNFGSFGVNGNATYLLAGPQGSGSFAHTPGNDNLWEYYVRTVDSGPTTVYTGVELGTRLSSGSLAIGNIGDSITSGTGASATDPFGGSVTQASTRTGNVSKCAFYLSRLACKPVTSYSHGYAGTAVGDWQKGVASAANVSQARNFPGHTGNVLYDQAIADWTAGGGVGLVMVALGTNDFATTLSAFQASYSALVASLRSDLPSAKILLRPIPPKRGANNAATYASFNAYLASLADNVNVFYGPADLPRQCVVNEDTWWSYSLAASTGDPVHPVDAGHDGIGALTARAIYSQILNPAIARAIVVGG